MNQKIVRVALALLFVSLLITSPQAQQAAASKQSPEDRVALYQALLDLTSPWTVMCIGAHPDDEDGTSLIVMRRKYGAHTVSLFSTFGEGGQNAIGPELYEELGAIRVNETLAASKIQGSEAYFLGLKDYGFSKSADEAFKIWGHEEALRRMVLQIRKLRPDVIITNHSVTSNDHGQHQATARLTVEAFDEAADPKRFPEQLKDGVTVWQVQRLFVRAGRSSNPAPTETRPVVTIDPNDRDPVRDTTFAEEALRALQQHATQGPWPKTVAELAARFRNSTDGKLPLIRYVLVREAKKPEIHNTLDGVSLNDANLHNFLGGLRLPEDIAKQLAVPMFDDQSLIEYVKQPQRVLAALIDAQKRNAAAFGGRITASFVDPRAVRHRLLLSAAMTAASGITAKFISNQEVAQPGSAAGFRLELMNNGATEVRLDTVFFGAGYTNGHIMLNPVASLKVRLAPGKNISTPINYQVPLTAELTTPHAQHLYDGRVNGYPVAVSVLSEIQDVRFEIAEKDLIDISPPVEIAAISPEPLVVTPTTPANAQSFTVTLTNHQKVASTGRLAVTTNVSPLLRFENGPSFSLSANETKTIELPLGNALGTQRNGQRTTPSHTGMIPLSVLLFNGTSQSSSLTRSAQAVVVDARVSPNLRVGYIRGFDYSLPNALTALGVESKELSVDEVKTADLSKYTSVIVDNRVYESTPGLIAANQRLLDCVKDGGTLIVFYHKSDEWNPDERRQRPQLAPYKLSLGNERITDETAPITFLEPQHPLLNSPNKLGQEDFANWIQERGLYYPKEWDPQFHALLQSNDPGEAPLKGGLLVADYGRGHYIYSSMVWYRELRAGVPGAYRMLANMISYGARK